MYWVSTLRGKRGTWEGLQPKQTYVVLQKAQTKRRQKVKLRGFRGLQIAYSISQSGGSTEDEVLEGVEERLRFLVQLLEFGRGQDFLDVLLECLELGK